jgi:hypothetical protein
MSISLLQRLAAFLSIVGGVVLLIWFNPYDKSQANLVLGLAVIVLGLAPLWRWAQEPKTDPIPVLAMIGLFYALCFGLGGLVTPPFGLTVGFVTEAQYTVALLAALVSWLSLNVGYRLAIRFASRNVPELLAQLGTRYDGVALWVWYPFSLVADQAAQRLDLESVIQITYCVHMFLFLWVLRAAWGGRLSSALSRTVTLLILPLDVFLYSGVASGLLAPLLVFGQLVGLTYVVTKGRIPYLTFALLAATFLFLQPVKNAYRMEIWGQGAPVDRLEGTLRFIELGAEYYSGEYDANFSDDLNVAYTRINHLLVTAAVIADTPIVGFKEGQTYLPLLTKWIPRAIWPEKPREDLGNGWARDYGYLDKDDDVTSFNLPWLPEMYMNFGWAGVVAISFAVGWLCGFIWAKLAHASPSPVFAAGLIMLSPFFFPESNLSLGVGGLVISAASIALVSWTTRIVWGRPWADRRRGMPTRPAT